MTGNLRPTVYLLHGLLGTAHQHFAPQVRAWKDTFNVIPLDLPGHGRCPLDAQPQYIQIAVQYALAVMRRFGPGHVIAGSYLGAPVAVRCALKWPEFVNSLVLTGFVPDVSQDVFEMWLEGLGRLAAENEALVSWYNQTHGPRWSGTLAAYTEEVRHRYEEQVRVTGQMLGMLQRPTMLLNGSAKSNERNAALEGARFGPAVSGHVIEGAGHLPGQDRPEQFNAIVHSFWKECRLGADTPVSR